MASASPSAAVRTDDSSRIGIADADDSSATATATAAVLDALWTRDAAPGLRAAYAQLNAAAAPASAASTAAANSSSTGTGGSASESGVSAALKPLLRSECPGAASVALFEPAFCNELCTAIDAFSATPAGRAAGNLDVLEGLKLDALPGFVVRVRAVVGLLNARLARTSTLRLAYRSAFAIRYRSDASANANANATPSASNNMAALQLAPAAAAASSNPYAALAAAGYGYGYGVVPGMPSAAAAYPMAVAATPYGPQPVVMAASAMPPAIAGAPPGMGSRPAGVVPTRLPFDPKRLSSSAAAATGGSSPSAAHSLTVNPVQTSHFEHYDEADVTVNCNIGDARHSKGDGDAGFRGGALLLSARRWDGSTLVPLDPPVVLAPGRPYDPYGAPAPVTEALVVAHPTTLADRYHSRPLHIPDSVLAAARATPAPAPAAKGGAPAEPAPVRVPMVGAAAKAKVKAKAHADAARRTAAAAAEAKGAVSQADAAEVRAWVREFSSRNDDGYGGASWTPNLYRSPYAPPLTAGVSSDMPPRAQVSAALAKVALQNYYAYDHELGRAVVHSGYQCHRSRPLQAGTRINVVVWLAASHSFAGWTRVPKDVQWRVLQFLTPASGLVAFRRASKACNALVSGVAAAAGPSPAVVPSADAAAASVSAAASASAASASGSATSAADTLLWRTLYRADFCRYTPPAPPPQQQQQQQQVAAPSARAGAQPPPQLLGLYPAAAYGGGNVVPWDPTAAAVAERGPRAPYQALAHGPDSAFHNPTAPDAGKGKGTGTAADDLLEQWVDERARSVRWHSNPARVLLERSPAAMALARQLYAEHKAKTPAAANATRTPAPAPAFAPYAHLQPGMAFGAPALEPALQFLAWPCLPAGPETSGPIVLARSAYGCNEQHNPPGAPACLTCGRRPTAADKALLQARTAAAQRVLACARDDRARARQRRGVWEHAYVSATVQRALAARDNVLHGGLGMPQPMMMKTMAPPLPPFVPRDKRPVAVALAGAPSSSAASAATAATAAGASVSASQQLLAPALPAGRVHFVDAHPPSDADVRPECYVQ